MSTIIGLSVGSESIRAVGVDDARVIWAIEAGRSSANDLDAQIVKVLSRAQMPRWRRGVVRAAIGPSTSQTKLLTGLPAIPDSDALRAIVRENVSRFFLKNGIPLVVGGVQCESPGSSWATALDAPVVHSIESACQALGLRVQLVVPSLVALTRACEDQSLEWRDGDVRTELTIGDRRLRATRRLPEVHTDESRVGGEPLLVPELRSFGPDAVRYADAYGVTQLARDEPLALRSDSGELDSHAARREVRIAGTVLAAAMVIAAGAPITAIAVRAHRTARELALIAPKARRAERAEVDLWQISEALSEIADFDRSRRSPIRFLAQLTRTMPEGSVLLTTRTDSAGGTIVLMAPHAASALAVLDSVAGIAAPQIIGPVTKEVLGSRELERATVQYRWTPAPARSR